MTLPLQKPREMFSSYTVKRYAAGTYVSGTWTPGAQSSLSVVASVQPAKADELIYLPEAQRTTAAIKIYTDSHLQTGNEKTGVQADRITYQGEDWEIQQIYEHELGIAHYKAIATRFDRA